MEIVPRFAKTEDLRAKEEFWLGESLFNDGCNTDDAPLSSTGKNNFTPSSWVTELAESWAAASGSSHLDILPLQ